MDTIRMNELKNAVKTKDYQALHDATSEITDEAFLVLFHVYVEENLKSNQNGFLDWALKNFPEQTFLHLPRLFFEYRQRNIILSLPYLKQYEYRFQKEVIAFVKAAFATENNKYQIIEKLDKIGFENDAVLEVIDHLEFILNLKDKNQAYSEKLKSEFAGFDFQTILFAFGIYLQELEDKNHLNELKFLEHQFLDLFKELAPADYNIEENDFNLQYSLFVLSLCQDFGFDLNNIDTIPDSFIKLHLEKYKQDKAGLRYRKIVSFFHAYYEQSLLVRYTDKYCLETAWSIKELPDGSARFTSDDENYFIADAATNFKYQHMLSYYLSKGEALSESEDVLSTVDSSQWKPGVPRINERMLARTLASSVYLNENGFPAHFSLNDAETSLYAVSHFMESMVGNSQARYHHSLMEHRDKPTVLKIVENLQKNLAVLPVSVRSMHDLAKTHSDNKLFSTHEEATAVMEFLSYDLLKKKSPKNEPILRIKDSLIFFDPFLQSTSFTFRLYDLIKSKDINDDLLYEKILLEKLEQHGFTTLKYGDQKIGSHQFDLLAYKDNVLFVGEVKSTIFRKTRQIIQKHISESIFNAKHQLDVRESFIINNWSDVMKKLGLSGIEKDDVQIKTLIISSTFEIDNIYFGDHQGISFFELTKILDNERHMLLAPDTWFLSYKHKISNHPLLKIVAQDPEQFIQSPDYPVWLSEMLGLQIDEMERIQEKHILYPLNQKASGKQFLELIEKGAFWDFIKESDLQEYTRSIKVKFIQDTQRFLELKQRADRLFNNKAYERALPVYRNLEQQFPHEHWAKFQLGLCYLSVHKPNNRKALECFLDAEKCLHENEMPANADTLVNIAMVYDELKDFSRAIDYYDKALSIAPAIDIIRNKAEVLLKNNNIRECLQFMVDMYYPDMEYNSPDYGSFLNFVNELESKWVQAEKENPENSHLMGQIRIIQKEYEEAITFLKQAAKLEQNPYYIYHKISMAYEFHSSLEEAIAWQKKALAIEQPTGEYYDRMGHLLVRAEQYEEALSFFNKAIAVDPEYYFAFYNRGVLYRKSEQFEKAIADFWQTLKLSNFYESAYENLIWIYQKTGRPGAAELTRQLIGQATDRTGN